KILPHPCPLPHSASNGSRWRRSWDGRVRGGCGGGFHQPEDRKLRRLVSETPSSSPPSWTGNQLAVLIRRPLVGAR
uniref:Uncharacterized protein n=1 Tax=Aegilops tauschii subsp. strangulata TaxID=200361 RepID=A0A452ZVZ0_AEGTS